MPSHHLRRRICCIEIMFCTLPKAPLESAGAFPEFPSILPRPGNGPWRVEVGRALARRQRYPYITKYRHTPTISSQVSPNCTVIRKDEKGFMFAPAGYFSSALPSVDAAAFFTASLLAASPASSCFAEASLPLAAD